MVVVVVGQTGEDEDEVGGRATWGDERDVEVLLVTELVVVVVVVEDEEDDGKTLERES